MLTSDDVRARVQAFVDDLASLVKASALEAVQAALAGASPEEAGAVPLARPKPGKRFRTSATSKAAPSSPRARAASPAAGARKRAPAQPRPAGELEALIDHFARQVGAHPGSNMTAVAHALGVATTALRYPAAKLIAEGRIRTEGKKQGMRYFPVPNA
jgi:hypothetical protein